MLRNRTEEEVERLTGVNVAVDPSKLALGKFESLENWVPAKKYKIKKKRGVLTLAGHGGIPTPSLVFPNPCGVTVPFLSVECGHQCPLTQFAQATYVTSGITGGPAIRITSGSTPTAFFGLAAIYVPSQTKVGLVRWQGEDLDGLPTVLASVVQTLVNGDVLKIEASGVDGKTYLVKVNGGTIITQSDTVSDTLADCIGFVEPVNATLP